MSQDLTEVSKISKVIVQGFYDDIEIPIEKFDVERYQAMIQAYRKGRELVEKDRIRSHVSLILCSEDYSNEVADDEAIRAILKDCGKRVGELPLSLVL